MNMQRTYVVSVDKTLWLMTLLLLVIGIASVYSASQVVALHNTGDAWYDVKRQLVFAVLGIGAMLLAMRVPLWRWQQWATPLFFGALLLLIIVLIPGIGVVRGGARSWLGIGSFGIQPSEFMKLALIFLLAKALAHPKSSIRHTSMVTMTLLVVGAVFGLIMLQPDMGTGAVICGTVAGMVIVAGMRKQTLFLLMLGSLCAVVVLIAIAPYRLLRLTAFLDPWSDPLGAGYQTIQSLYALAPGGLVGVGFGHSHQKYSYLPEPQTDFIFAIFSEEWGWLGSCTLLVLYLVLILRGWQIAYRQNDAFSTLVATGIVAMWSVQVVINIGVVMGLLPVTGITLPLMSAGGSSLILLLVSLGILHRLAQEVRV